MLQRFSLLALLIGALVLNCSAPVQAKDSAAQTVSRRAIVSAQARLDQARMKKDLPTIMSLISDDFRLYTINRNEQDRESYARVQRFAWNIAPNAPAPRMKTTVTKWQWRGPDAVVWTTMVMSASGPGGKAGGSVKSREYWGKTAKGWQLRQVVELSGTMNFGGETVNL